MPYRRSRRPRRRRRRRMRPRRRRRYRRRRSSGARGFGNSRTVRLMRMPSFIPDKIKINMIYTGGRTFTGTSQYQFSGNNIYDPNITGGGNWPLYYDFWKQTYQRYYVVKTTLMANLRIDSVTSACGIFGIHPTADPSIDYSLITGGINRFRALPLVNYRNLGSGDDQKYRLKSSITTRKFFQFDFPIAQLTSDVDNGPFSEITWDVVCLQSTTGVLEVRAEIKIIYQVVFYGRTYDPIAQPVPP